MNIQGFVFQNKNGFTLLEMIMAIFLGSLILFSLMSLYLGVQKNILKNEALINVQNNIRISTQVLRRAIETAGYVTLDDKIHAYWGAELKPGTEGFTIKGASTNGVNLQETMENLQKIKLTDISHISMGDTLVIHDEQTYEIFTVKEMQKTNIIIPEKPLKKLYQKHTEVNSYCMNSYFISKTGRFNTDGTMMDALYVKDIHSRKTELIEGISNMKVEYSILEDEILKNVSSNELLDGSNVKGVHIALLFTSFNAFPLKKEVFVYVALREF